MSRHNVCKQKILIKCEGLFLVKIQKKKKKKKKVSCLLQILLGILMVNNPMYKNWH